MVFTEKVDSKILSPESLLKRINFWRGMKDKIVFTNGCFDILHFGHIQLLANCNEFGERLIVGLNSDNSVKQLKGNDRPLNTQQNRAALLAATQFVDAVVIFDEETPEHLIQLIKPDVLVKGGDWAKADIVGAGFVESYGGEVRTVPYVEGFSTTGILAKSKGR